MFRCELVPALVQAVLHAPGLVTQALAVDASVYAVHPALAAAASSSRMVRDPHSMFAAHAPGTRCAFEPGDDDPPPAAAAAAGGAGSGGVPAGGARGRGTAMKEEGEEEEEDREWGTMVE